MAILSDIDIKKALDEKKIIIDPLKDEKQIQPSSVDLRIGNKFKGFKIITKPFIDPFDEVDLESYMEEITISEKQPFIIHPGEFTLATTYETVKLPSDIVARVEGRSSIGRLGITSNIGKMPVALYPGQRVCQIVFETMTSPSVEPYGHHTRDSKYMNQKEPQVSKIKQDFDIKGE